jgi:hypothetical protein
MKKLLIALTFLIAPALAHATIINGGFETGDLTGWSTIGDALLVGSSFGVNPPQGNFQLLITTAPETLFGEHPQSYSGTNSANFQTLEAFFGFTHIKREASLNLFCRLAAAVLFRDSLIPHQRFASLQPGGA